MAWGGVLQLLPHFYQPLPVVQMSVDMSYRKMRMCLPSQRDFKTSFPMFLFTGVPALLDIDILRCHNSSNSSGLLRSSSVSAFAPLFLLHWLHFSVRPLTHLFRLWLYWTVHSTLHVAAATGTLLCTWPGTLPWAWHGPIWLTYPSYQDGDVIIGLYPSLPNVYVEILTPNALGCEMIWK